MARDEGEAAERTSRSTARSPFRTASARTMCGRPSSLAPLQHAEQDVVGRGREGHDYVLDLVLLDDPLEIPARSKDG